MPALFSNPITAIIGGALIGTALLVNLLSNRTEKKLRSAIKSTYGMEVKDMAVLKQVKEMGEQVFGKGQVKSHIQETVNLPEVRQMLSTVAMNTGQMDTKLAKSYQLVNANNPANVFNRMPQYALGTNYVPVTGPAYLHQGEAVIPASQNMGGGSAAIAKLEATVARLAAIIEMGSPGDVVQRAANDNPHTFTDAVLSSTSMDKTRGDNLKTNVGLNRF